MNASGGWSASRRMARLLRSAWSNGLRRRAGKGSRPRRRILRFGSPAVRAIVRLQRATGAARSAARVGNRVRWREATGSGQAPDPGPGRSLRAARRGARAGRDRRRGDRQGAGAAGGRPGGDLGRALDARRPAAAAGAADPRRTGCRIRLTSTKVAYLARARMAAIAAARPTGSTQAAPARLPDASLLRAGAGEGDRRRSTRRWRESASEVEASAVAEAAAPRGTADRRDRRWPAAAATAARSSTATARGCAPTSPPPSTGWRRPPRADGVDLLVVSGFRSDAEQAALFAAHPDPQLGGAAGSVAAPLRDRARPRSRIRLRLARRQRQPLRLRPALLVGGLALRLRPPARRRARQAGNALGWTGGGTTVGAARPARLRSRPLPRAVARRGLALERLRPPCSPRS